MAVWICVLIGVAVNLDNFIIGLNFGIRKQRIGFGPNLLMAACTGCFSYLSTKAAFLLSGIFLSIANLTGALVLIVFGLWSLFHKSEEEPGERYRELTFQKALALGLLLAVNCVPPSFSAGAVQIPPYLMSLSAGVCALLCMGVSNWLGFRISSSRKFHFLEPAAAILLIAVGGIELFL